ncbi:MAG: hypothetical protein PUB20_08810 [Clostridia bacterium]|nr:hypothetical protein [Clostridia bacterium]
MKENWKILIGVLSALLCTVIVCITINFTVKQAAKVQADSNESTSENSNYNAAVAPTGNVVIKNPGINSGEVNTDANGVVSADNNSAVQQGNSNTQSNSTTKSNSNSVNPLSFNKAQLAAYYNSCLKKSYSQAKMTATKTQHVNVTVSGIDIGSLNMDVDKMAQSIISSNTKNNDKPETKTFTNGKASDGTSASSFVEPANLYAEAAKSITIKQSGSGYVMNIVLNQESCSHTGTAKYNASCSMPLDINAIDFGAIATINKCEFNYPGTKLTATIDSQGRVTRIDTTMPLTVKDAEGKAMGVTIKVASISGTWTCHDVMKFS